MTTTVFLRNASPVSIPAAYRDGLILDAFAQLNTSTIVANFSTLVEQVGQPSQAGIDFLWLSTAIYIADKKTSRRYSADRWTRAFEVTAPVTRPDCWTTAAPTITEALSFLTGDRWVLHWRPEQNRIWNARSVGRASCDSVCLFSGGLDSLVGAINLLEDEAQTRILLLGHYDSPLTAKVSLPRFGGVEKHGIYSTEGGEYAKATEDLHQGVQTRGSATGQEQWQTDEPDCAGVGDQ